VTETVLVTGGAGFIGRFVCRALLEQGKGVRVLDSFIEQVHGGAQAHVDPRIELIEGDIRDTATVMMALRGADAVIHLAAEVGVGQSMYAVDRYVGVNDLGTAVLFQALIERPVRRVVVASSMSVYGEGLYRTEEGDLIEDAARAPDAAGERSFDPLDERGRPLIPVPTPEWKRPALASVYALTKFVQERLTLTVAPAYGMEAVALRLWNVYGPGQALSNPYTGVLAIFASRLLNANAPLIYEDGRQLRDFVHAEDVADAFVLALDKPSAAGGVFNIASGENRTIRQIAEVLAEAMNRPDLKPEITGRVRLGDVRHCIPDLDKSRTELGFRPRRDFREGLVELAGWVAQQKAQDRAADARRELEERGLFA
jgi:dTDP-L-rhamnose 4-epimerase